jgi:tetratricopeptide (TPR) repeat protein
MAEGAPGGHHPSTAELNRFLLGDMSPRQAAPVLAHLITGCEHCRKSMAPLASAMFGAGDSQPDAAVEALGSEYDFPLFKAFATARRYAATAARTGAGREPAPSLKEAPLFDTAERAERDWARCQALIEHCRALRATDPENMVLVARLAVSFSEHLDAGTAGPAALADQQARAWAELGNARRIADDLAGAERDLAYALTRSADGTGDPLLLARLMDLTASLYTDQRRFQEALHLLDMVYAIYEKAGDTHLAGRALISKGATANYAFDVEEAVGLLSRGIELIDPSRDPKLLMAGLHNLAWCLVECGQAELAHQLFTLSQELFANYIERLDAIKSGWLEGRIAAVLGQDERAEAKFREARSSFQEIQMPYDVALVSLDMAALWLRAGRTAEIKHLIDHTITIFRSRKIRREAIGMLLVVREAFEKDRVTHEILRKAYTELVRLQDPPAHRGRVSA